MTFVRGRLAVAGALALGVGLTGCATVPAPGGAQAAEPQDTSQTLRIMGPDFPYTEATVEEFRRRHPDVSVEYVEGGVSFEDGSAQTMLRSGQGPDVLMVNSGPGRVGLLAEAGLITPLGDLYAEHGLEERYRPDVLEQIRAGANGGGEIFEIVEGLDVFQVYYNEEIFAEHGLEVPTAYDELLDACATLREAGVRPLLAGVRDNFAGGWLLGTLVQASAGAQAMREIIYDDEPFDQDAVVRAAEMLTELIDNGCIDAGQAAALDGAQAEAGFWRGNGAMVVQPQGPIIEERHDGADVSHFGAFPMPPVDPTDPARPTAGLALSWIASNSTRSASAVEAWLAWVSSEDYLALTAENGGTLVPAQVVPDGIEVAPAIRDALDKTADGSGYNPSVYLNEAAKQAWYDAVQGLISGSAEPAPAMRAVEDARATN
ncbi:ABC transporter substrate-binding protein [Georgenia deserti]|uniref:ABC transporter substrate-binding protein n=1 Tax=Georgenia deserti TaxID=2093781 RepID=A0ABW4L7P8_9MICO